MEGDVTVTGKTHIAIGIAAGIAGHWINIPHLNQISNLLSTGISINNPLFPTLLAVGAAWFGSLAPDLDQPGSTLSRDIAGPFGGTKIAAFLGGLGAFLLATHLPAILGRVPYAQIGLIIIGGVLLAMSLLHHRGITHSLLGLLLAGYVVQRVTLVLASQGMSYAANLLMPFLVGYGAHLIADFLTNSGIAPLYLPFLPSTHRRLSLPISIRTGSFLDRVVVRWGAWGVIAFSLVH